MAQILSSSSQPSPSSSDDPTQPLSDAGRAACHHHSALAAGALPRTPCRTALPSTSTHRRGGAAPAIPLNLTDLQNSLATLHPPTRIRQPASSPPPGTLQLAAAGNAVLVSSEVLAQPRHGQWLDARRCRSSRRPHLRPRCKFD